MPRQLGLFGGEDPVPEREPAPASNEAAEARAEFEWPDFGPEPVDVLCRNAAKALRNAGADRLAVLREFQERGLEEQLDLAELSELFSQKVLALADLSEAEEAELVRLYDGL